MNKLIGKSIIGAAAAVTLAATAAPAEARHWRHDGDSDALAAGIIGLGIGAAIASSHHGGYYGGGHYGGGYGGGYYGRPAYYGAPVYYGRPAYYGRPHYRPHHGYYGRRCFTRRVWDPYWGRRVRVRVC
jgi:hypothetical protein